MRWWILLLAVVLVACAKQQPVCTAPYTLQGGKCCLDADNDTVCDAPPEEGALDCSLCPPKFVTEVEERTVFRYVCMNGSIMNDPGNCEERVVSNARSFHPNKEQDDTKILEFDARPACRGKFKAAELHIIPYKPASIMTVQVMSEPNTVYTDRFEMNGSRKVLDDEYFYIGFCDDADCAAITDVQLLPDQAYLVRMEIRVGGERIVTRDELLDPTPDGKYSQQQCQ